MVDANEWNDATEGEPLLSRARRVGRGDSDGERERTLDDLVGLEDGGHASSACERLPLPWVAAAAAAAAVRERVDVDGETVELVREREAAADARVVGRPRFEGWPREEEVVVGDGLGSRWAMREDDGWAC